MHEVFLPEPGEGYELIQSSITILVPGRTDTRRGSEKMSGMKQGPVAYKEMLQTPGLICTAKKAEKIFASLYQDGMRPTSRRKLVKPKANTAVNYPRSFSGNKNSAKIWDKVLQQPQGAKPDPAQQKGAASPEPAHPSRAASPPRPPSPACIVNNKRNDSKRAMTEAHGWPRNAGCSVSHAKARGGGEFPVDTVCYT